MIKDFLIKVIVIGKKEKIKNETGKEKIYNRIFMFNSGFILIRNYMIVGSVFD